jgi:hypothetical protein
MNSNENVVSRLRQRLKDARSLGFKVRMELLDDEHASWCEIAGVPTLFVDLSQTAAEQLQQVEETLAAYLDGQAVLEAGSPKAGSPKTAPALRADADLAKRAA